jgi:hypothetical protein
VAVLDVGGKRGDIQRYRNFSVASRTVSEYAVIPVEPGWSTTQSADRLALESAEQICYFETGEET